jgi:hypothetical protein
VKKGTSSPPAAAPGPAEANPLETAARASLSGRYGRPLSDAEWQEASRTLLEFFGLLQRWEREGREGKKSGNDKDDTNGNAV